MANPLDYDALAAKTGGKSAIDYDALASKYGGTTGTDKTVSSADAPPAVNRPPVPGSLAVSHSPQGANTISQDPPQSIWEGLRKTVANSAIGHSVESTMPKVADALGLHPTETVYSPDYAAHREQLLAPEEIIPQTSHDPVSATMRGVLKGAGGMTSAPAMATIAGTAITGGLLSPAVPAIGRLISLGFTVQSANDMVKQSPQLYKSFSTGDYEGGMEQLGRMGFDAVMLKQMAEHAGTGEGIGAADPRMTPAGPRDISPLGRMNAIVQDAGRPVVAPSVTPVEHRFAERRYVNAARVPEQDPVALPHAVAPLDPRIVTSAPVQGPPTATDSVLPTGGNISIGRQASREQFAREQAEQNAHEVADAARAAVQPWPPSLPENAGPSAGTRFVGSRFGNTVDLSNPPALGRMEGPRVDLPGTVQASPLLTDGRPAATRIAQRVPLVATRQPEVEPIRLGQRELAVPVAASEAKAASILPPEVSAAPPALKAEQGAPSSLSVESPAMVPEKGAGDQSTQPKSETPAGARYDNSKHGETGKIADALNARGYQQLGSIQESGHPEGGISRYARFRTPDGFELEIRNSDHPAAPNNPAYDVRSVDGVDRLIETVEARSAAERQWQSEGLPKAQARTSQLRTAWDAMTPEQKAQVWQAAGLKIGKNGPQWIDESTAFGGKFRGALEKAVPASDTTTPPAAAGNTEAARKPPTAFQQITGQTEKVETDPSRIQEIKNSIAEGEGILQRGKTISGRKMSDAELAAVQRSIDSSKAKLPEESPAPRVEASAPAESASAAADQQGQELSSTLNRQPDSISRTSGEMERNSPLFSGSEASGIGNLFSPEPSRAGSRTPRTGTRTPRLGSR